MIYRFGGFELDTDRHELRENDRPVHAEPQTVRMLAYLLENRDRMISRQEMIENVWQGRIVSDWALSAAIKSLRKILQDTTTPRRIIETVHGKGFRFLPDVQVRGRQMQEPIRVPSDSGNTESTLAIIPFADLSSTQDRQYFADGISEDLITDLANTKNLKVSSRNASFRFRNHGLESRALGENLGVRYILEGSLRREGKRLRINVVLTDSASGEQLWADRFEGFEADVFALQDDVCSRIVGSLKLHLALGDNRRGTRDPRAYDFCLRGRSEYYQYTPKNLAKALEFFETATEIDPEYAEAYAYQAYCRNSLYVFAWPGSDVNLDPVIALARKAISLDEKSGLAYLRLGWSLGFVGDPAEAIAAFETATKLAPRNAEVWHGYGETLNRLAMPKRALPILERALTIDSFVPPSWDFARGHSRILLRQYDRALEYIIPVLERVPGFVPARVQLARAYAEMDRSDYARRTIDALLSFAPRYRLSNAKRMFPYPVLTERDRFEAALREAGLPDE